MTLRQHTAERLVACTQHDFEWGWSGAVHGAHYGRDFLLSVSTWGQPSPRLGDSDSDILVIDEAPGGVLELKLDIGASLPDRVRWTDVVVLTPGGVAKRLQWEDETFMQMLDEATVLYESEAETRP